MSESEEESKPAAEIVEEEEESNIVLERVYTVPLWKFIYKPKNKRAKKAISILKEFMMRHMKGEHVIITPEVNEKIWERGIEKPPRRIRVRATKDTEGVVRVYLAE
ncbi:MAG: 50S ribosomal protein L31e [Candidatus Asgardarchaeia archaeon]